MRVVNAAATPSVCTLPTLTRIDVPPVIAPPAMPPGLVAIASCRLLKVT